MAEGHPPKGRVPVGLPIPRIVRHHPTTDCVFAALGTSHSQDSAVALSCPGGPFGSEPRVKPWLATESAFYRLGKLGQERVVDQPRRGEPASHQPGAYRRLRSDLPSQRLDEGHGLLTRLVQDLRHRSGRPGGRFGHPLERRWGITCSLQSRPGRPQLILSVDQRRTSQIRDQSFDVRVSLV